MADNLVADPGVGGATLAANDIAGVHYPRAKVTWGAPGTANDTSAAAPMPVVQTGALPAGTNNIGDVDVLTLPTLPAGTNNIGDVDVLTLPTLPAGGNTIGGVNVITLPALVASTANIGDVDVLTLPTLPAGTNNIGDVDIASIAAGTNNIGDVDVLTLPALVAGNANIGDVDVASIAAGSNLIGRVNIEPQAANGLTISRVISAASTNGTSVKASAGLLYAIYAHNINATVRYLKIYNKASAPTVGTDTPVLTLPIPGNTNGTGFVLETAGLGATFATGIATALTTGVADTDTGAVAANEIVVNLFYK